MYFVTICIFAVLLYLCGEEGLDGLPDTREGKRLFEDAFYLSVQSFSTIGYGGLQPKNTGAHLIIVRCLADTILWSYSQKLRTEKFSILCKALELLAWNLVSFKDRE